MSIKSTHLVTREFAIKAILSKQHDIYDLTNEELSYLLEESIHNGFYNFSVVSESEIEDNKHKDYPLPYLDDIYDLPERNDAW